MRTPAGNVHAVRLLRNPVLALSAVVIGFVLLFSQSLIVLLGHTLNNVEAIVMWAGLGVATLGALLLVLVMMRSDPEG